MFGLWRLSKSWKMVSFWSNRAPASWKPRSSAELAKCTLVWPFGMVNTGCISYNSCRCKSLIRSEISCSVCLFWNLRVGHLGQVQAGSGLLWLHWWLAWGRRGMFPYVSHACFNLCLSFSSSAFLSSILSAGCLAGREASSWFAATSLQEQRSDDVDQAGRIPRCHRPLYGDWASRGENESPKSVFGVACSFDVLK